MPLTSARHRPPTPRPRRAPSPNDDRGGEVLPRLPVPVINLPPGTHAHVFVSMRRPGSSVGPPLHPLESLLDRFERLSRLLLTFTRQGEVVEIFPKFGMPLQ